MSELGRTNIDARVDTYAKRGETLPISTQVAIATVLPNIVNGANWGFSTMKELSFYANELKNDKNVTVRKIAGDNLIVEVDARYLISATSSIAKDIILKKDLERMVSDSTKALVDFEKFLISKGKSGFCGIVGLYCINDSTAMVYEGVTYPAFRVKLIQALELCNRYKYLIQVGGKFITPAQAIASKQQLFDSLLLAPSKNGVFVKLKCVATPEEIKELEKTFKAQK